MLIGLYCSGCKQYFPCRIVQGKDGQRTVEPCPQCGSLENVKLPPGLSARASK
jgi:hypothetical protein